MDSKLILTNDQPERVLLVYHRVDFDGILSGCIAKSWLEENNELVTILGWNYQDKLPNPEDLIKRFKKIYLVDISFPETIMKALADSGKLIWIDHHHSSISSSEKLGYSEVSGIRKNGVAACELSWEYFHPDLECPELIQYCGAYDVWDKTKFDWNKITLPVQYALRSVYNLDFHGIYKNFGKILNSCKYFINIGRPIRNYLRGMWRGWIISGGFPITVANKYKGICLLAPQSGSAPFESVLEDYDIYVVVSKKNNDVYKVGMYKEPDRLTDFNLADYVSRTYGTGGGQVSACGFTINQEQFERLTRDEVI